MSKHACPRCGFESPRRRDRWYDHHPLAAAIVAVPTLFTLISVMLVYPWFTIPVTVIVCALLLNRAARWRAAIAARADWEYRQQMARYQQQPPPDAEEMRRTAWQPDLWPPASPLPVRPSNPAPWHVVTQWPTRRFQKGQP